MFEKIDSDYIIIIRSAGERTKEACQYIVSQEVATNDIHILQLEPFEEALRESYRKAKESNKKWLITIDADILPRKGFIKEINEMTAGISNRVFCIKPMIYDKLFLKHRMAGFRVYRTSYLEEAQVLIPPNGEQIRPEAYVVSQMEKKGYKTKIFENVIGLHDYEQYYKDIYRKAYFHSEKHIDLVIDSMGTWKKQMHSDLDYAVALKGAIDGLLSEDQPKPDIRFFDGKSSKSLKKLNLTEKNKLDNANISDVIDKILLEAGPFHKSYKWKSIKNDFKEKGFIGGSVFSLGTLFEVTGKKLRKVADNRFQNIVK
ncbi:MAG: hypothetical protein JJU28_19565 [Cyclobacteriaceae bacterium]|nr:hypothetical protein [Cyclobacteriaceae bacterium]